MRQTYHIVSHSHWDREWYKSFEQFRSMLVTMVDDLLELFQRDPSYLCFTLDGQAIVLEDYLAVRPEREPEIRRLVADGKLMIGPWYVLPDEFLVSGEATVRNLFVGRSITKRFGKPMDVGYIPDSFGHIAMMPAILRGFAIDNAVVYRGFGGEPGETTSEYTWIAPDGSRVLLEHLFRNGYSAGYFHQETDEEVLGRFSDLRKELDERATTSQRLLMNGGDHHWPDPRLPRVLEFLRRSVDAQIVHSTLPRFMEALKREISGPPEVRGELRFGYRYAFAVLGGVYSSRMYLKQRNWFCQSLLQRYVEPLNAIAVSGGMRTQFPLILHAWKTLMQNHPHDSICGCSIDSVHREMMSRFQAVEDIGRTVMDASIERLVPYDDRATRDDQHLFFFNPSPFRRDDIAKAEVAFYLQDIVVGLNPDVRIDPKLPPVSGFALIDSSGNEVPYQVLTRAEGYDITYSRYNYPKQTYADRCDILVDVRTAPPLGTTGYRIEKRSRFPRYGTGLKVGRNYLENEFVRLDINAHGGCSLHDKQRGQTYRDLNVFEDSGDVGDEYNYSYPRKDRRITSDRSRAKIRIVERGPLRGAIEAEIILRLPDAASDDRSSRSRRLVAVPVRTTYFLTYSGRSVTIETRVENTAKDHRFRALFTPGIRTDRVLVDSQFCILERQQEKHDVRGFSIEHPARVAPMQRFVTVRKGSRGLTLLTDGLPEYELKLDGRGTLALTLLRCVGQLAGENLITRPGGKAGWHNETPDAQCQGSFRFRYAVLPHGGDDADILAIANGEAEHFHYPLIPIRRKNSGLPLAESSFVSLDSPRLALTSLKQAEDGNGVILRVQNIYPTATEAVARFSLPVQDAWRTRLDEENIEHLIVRNSTDLVLSVPPRSLLTLRVVFARS